MGSRSKEDDDNDLPEIPQSFDEIYKLSSKTKRKNKAKKHQSGANAAAEDGTAGSSSNPTEEAFDFKQYFAQDKDTSAHDTSADGTLSLIQEIGWVNDEDVADLRDEYRQVMEDNSATLANGASNQDSLRASAPSASGQPGQPNQTLWRSLEKGGSGRLSNSFDRASAKPTKSNSNNSNNSTNSYPNNISMAVSLLLVSSCYEILSILIYFCVYIQAPSSSIYEKVSNKQHIVGALSGTSASSTTKLAAGQGKNRPGSMKGSKAKAKPIDSQQHPYFGAFAKK